MHLSFPYTIAIFASLVHGQAFNTSESSPDPSATFPTSPNTFNGGTTPTASDSISPSNPPGSASTILSDKASSQMMVAGTPITTFSSSGSIQSSMTAMSTNSAVASGSRTSRTANATNTTTTSAPTTGLAKTNIAGQIRDFADTAVIFVLIGMFAGL